MPAIRPDQVNNAVADIVMTSPSHSSGRFPYTEALEQMDSLALILLTIPIFYPVVMGLDFYGMPPVDKSIWFGILALMVVEIGLVHPPLGMNLFIIQKLAKDTPYIETAKGVMPFLASDLVRIVLLLLMPGLSLWLVHLNH
ncbi:MAG: TRAP transporter large permease subunit [Burkholderiales bacterium]